MAAVAGERKLRVGMVGAGYVSSYHLRAVKSLPFAEVVAIADLDQAKAQELAAIFGVPKVYRTLGEMNAEKLDVVHILTPPAYHAELSIQAMEAGAHVFVEKPMAETPGDCERMLEVARRTGRVLSVDHSARMDPIVLKALDDCELGRDRRRAVGHVSAQFQLHAIRGREAAGALRQGLVPVSGSRRARTLYD